jgi:hypothetical protein
MLAPTTANISATAAPSTPPYCPIECLDQTVAREEIFALMTIIIWLWAVPIRVWLWVIVLANQKQEKTMLKKLVRTPPAKRTKKLQYLYERHKVEYVEVEDDGGDFADRLTVKGSLPEK